MQFKLLFAWPWRNHPSNQYIAHTHTHSFLALSVALSAAVAKLSHDCDYFSAEYFITA